MTEIPDWQTIVPIKPTKAMQIAGSCAGLDIKFGVDWPAACRIWAAMIEAWGQEQQEHDTATVLDTWRRLAHADGLEITSNLLAGSIAGSVVALLYDPQDARKLQGGVALSVNGLERELGEDDLVATRYYNAMRTLRASQEH